MPFGARKYDILVPKNHNNTLLFCISGWGQKIKSTIPKMFDLPNMTQFDKLAVDRRYILVYPHAQGIIPSWSFKNKKDLNFLSLLLSTITLQYDITKIFGCGFSQGGVMIQALEEFSFMNFDGMIIHSSGPLEEGLEVYKSKIKIERSNSINKRHPRKVIAVLGGKDRILGKKGLSRLEGIINRYEKRKCMTLEVYEKDLGHEWANQNNNDFFNFLEDAN